jgi:hypothetical protein
MICDDCKGSKKYVGATHSEDCRACRGTGQKLSAVPADLKETMVAWLQSRYSPFYLWRNEALSDEHIEWARGLRKAMEPLGIDFNQIGCPE